MTGIQEGINSAIENSSRDPIYPGVRPSTTKPFVLDGNTLSDSSGRTYTWDSQNRMASCTYQGQTTTFSYGSDGLRRSMTVGGVTTDYAYDGTMLVREFQINQQTGLLAPSVTYMVGPMGPCCRINEQNQSEGYYPAGVQSTTPLTRGVTKWYVYDGLGSVVAELDDNNNMTTSRQYDVYGASVFALSDYSLFRKDTSDQLN